MKEKVLGLLLAIAIVLMPMSVKAASFKGTVFGSADDKMSSITLNNNSILCPKSLDGATATCYIGISVTEGTATNFSVDVVLTNMTYKSYEELGDWTAPSPKVNGNKVSFDFSSKTGVSAGSRKLVAKVTYTVNNQADDCRIQLAVRTTETPTTYPSCGTQGGKYYCKNSQECTKAQYEKECLPENPKTGSAIPYVIVLGGLGVAGALYFVTRKKAKLYHV